MIRQSKKGNRMGGYSAGSMNLPLHLGLGLLALSACATGGDTAGVTRTDSAGIEIVTSSGIDRALEWRFHRELALGGADEGPESFYRVVAQYVGADANGNLFILDRPNSRVVVFDSNGQFVRSMGRAGGGPGEFQMIASMSVSPDGKVAVFDFGKGGFVWFDEHGEVEEEERFPHYPMSNGQRHFDRFNDTTLVLTSISESEAEERLQVLRQIVGPDTLNFAELPIPHSEMAVYMECGGGLSQPPLFAPDITWAASSGVVVMGTTTEYSVSFIYNGQTTRMVRRDIAPIPASRDQAIEYLGEGYRIDFGRGPCLIAPAEMVDNRGFAEMVPLIQSVLVGPNGELWVRRFATPRRTVGPIDVFDATGAYVGTIDIEPFEPVLLLPGGRVGIIEKDESDIERLVIMSIQRGEG